MISRRLAWFTLLALPVPGVLLSSCAREGAGAVALVPQPVGVSVESGTFPLKKGVRVLTGAELQPAADFLVAQLNRATGWGLQVAPTAGAAEGSDATITFVPAAKGASPEAYELRIRPESIRITAGGAAGAFYAVQTLLQTCPPEVYHPAGQVQTNWSLPCLTVTDEPRFSWRGFLLDTARHFFTVEELQHVMDTLAVHKLNRFQLHLTDDQGWRLEIREYPKLTEVGAWRSGIGFGLDPKTSRTYGPDGRYGGYYSREQVRQLVNYAAARHLTIVPEIEMPGHAGAALSAYPQLSCFGGPYTTDVHAGVFAAVFCPGKEETFVFLENVLREVMEMFPGKYIHVGGDEVPKDNWKKCPQCQERIRAEGLRNEEELQSYFLSRIGKFIYSQGRVMVGWSEMLQGGLPPNAILMDWIGGAVQAATNNHDVVLAPTQYAYFDYYQSTNRSTEPRAIGGYVPLRRVFEFEPVPDTLPAQFHPRILGPQANLWTEYIASIDHVQYMMFPRLCAMAEVGWSPRDRSNYDDFKRRLETHLKRLEAMNVRYRPGLDEPITRGQP